MNIRKMDGKRFDRTARFVPATADRERRTIELTWSTGARVLRSPWFDEPYYEELSLEPEHVRMDRLNAGAPLLDTHQSQRLTDQIGVVERAWLEDGIGKALVRFSERDEVDPIFQDVISGIIRNVSFGYKVYRYEEMKNKEDTYPTLRATDYEPYEISFVPIPADSGAGSRADEAPSPEKQVDEQALNQIATAKERQRIMHINELCQKHKLDDTFTRELIEGGISLDKSREKITDKILEKDAGEISSSHQITSGRLDENLTRREAICNAILHRYDPSLVELKESARPYRTMSLIDIAKLSLEAAGIHTGSISRNEIVNRSFHSTSDFPMILGNVAHLSLLSSYERLIRQQTFTPLVKIVSASDFKPMVKVRLGEIPTLKQVPEGAEVTAGTIGEGSESYAIATFARKFTISRQAIINDSLRALDEIGLWGAAAARLESQLVWDIFVKNQKMSDGKGLFHADHGNLSKVGAALSIDSLSEGELAMSEQMGIDGRDRLNIIPAYLVVPSSLKTDARKLIGLPISPSSVNDVNPFVGEMTVISEPLLNSYSRSAWYLAADYRAGIDMIEMAYLDGVRQPLVEYRQGFDTFGLEIRASLDVGVKAIDYRGFFKNTGKV